MGSMILATKPRRCIIEASPALASSVGSTSRFMEGADCASIVRCRNVAGRALCRDFCPALVAARTSSGVAEGLPVWLESPSGTLEQFHATFQRIANLPNGMVVAFFGDPQEMRSEREASDRLAEPTNTRRPRPTIEPEAAARRTTRKQRWPAGRRARSIGSPASIDGSA